MPSNTPTPRAGSYVPPPATATAMNLKHVGLAVVAAALLFGNDLSGLLANLGPGLSKMVQSGPVDVDGGRSLGGRVHIAFCNS